MVCNNLGRHVPHLPTLGVLVSFFSFLLTPYTVHSDYGDDDVSWSCTADVPGYFRLGSTDVICEGYDHPEDPYVLRGSCGVEYRLQLTNLGHEKFGNPMSISEGIYQLGSNVASILAVGLALLCVAVALRACLGGSPTRGGGGGGSGGGGGGRGMDDPPPPYPGSGPRKVYSSSTSSTGEGWRPGFWTGAATGAAASHILNRGRDERRGMGDPMAGPSRSGGAGDSPASRPSTGFGQTRRR